MATELEPEAESVLPAVPQVSSVDVGSWFERWTRKQEANPPILSTLIAGVIAPPLLFMIDRSILWSGIAPFRPYSTLMMAVSVAVLIGWLAIRHRQGWGG